MGIQLGVREISIPEPRSSFLHFQPAIERNDNLTGLQAFHEQNYPPLLHLAFSAPFGTHFCLAEDTFPPDPWQDTHAQSPKIDLSP